MTDTGMQLVIHRLQRVKTNPSFSHSFDNREKEKKKQAHLIGLEHSGITEYN